MGVRIAVLQHNVLPDPRATLRRVTHLANCLEGPDLVVLPELFASGYEFRDIRAQAQASESLVLPFLASLARNLSSWVAGTLITEEDHGFYNTLVVLDRQGEVIHRQAKTHLFKPMREHEIFSPGKEISVFDTEFGPWGGLVCYELRFPEIARKLRAQGAGLLIVPAEWPRVRASAWRVLCRARAVENQVFLVAVNRWGPGNTFYGGRSGVFGPRGDILLDMSDGQGAAWVDVDLAEVKKARAELPVWEDRREELY